jgi:hypothetical protein
VFILIFDRATHFGYMFVWVFGRVLGDNFGKRNAAYVRVLVRSLKNKIRGYVVPTWQPM